MQAQAGHSIWDGVGILTRLMAILAWTAGIAIGAVSNVGEQAPKVLIHKVKMGDCEVRVYRPTGLLELYIKNMPQPFSLGLAAGYNLNGKYVERHVTGFFGQPEIKANNIILHLQLEDDAKAEVQYQWSNNVVVAGYQMVAAGPATPKCSYALSLRPPQFYVHDVRDDLYYEPGKRVGVKESKVCKRFDKGMIEARFRDGTVTMFPYGEIATSPGSALSNLVVKGVFGAKTLRVEGSLEHGIRFGLYMPSNKMPAEGSYNISFGKNILSNPALSSNETIRISIE